MCSGECDHELAEDVSNVSFRALVHVEGEGAVAVADVEGEGAAVVAVVVEVEEAQGAEAGAEEGVVEEVVVVAADVEVAEYITTPASVPLLRPCV